MSAPEPTDLASHMVVTARARGSFDGDELIRAPDEKRTARGLTWTALGVDRGPDGAPITPSRASLHNLTLDEIAA